MTKWRPQLQGSANLGRALLPLYAGQFLIPAALLFGQIGKGLSGLKSSRRCVVAHDPSFDQINHIFSDIRGLVSDPLETTGYCDELH